MHKVDWFFFIVILYRSATLLLYPLLSLYQCFKIPRWAHTLARHFRQFVCVCARARADECVCRISVLVHCLCRALSHTQRVMWWWKWMGIVESYLLCGDTASLRGLCHDASAENGQPKGTGRLENTYCRCCLTLHWKRESERGWNFLYLPLHMPLWPAQNWRSECWEV